jgi:hypothetical protein
MMTDASTMPLADTEDMVQVHRVFREAFRAAPALIGSVAAGDAARAEVVGAYYANVLEFLRVHHEGEDALVWPKLLERAKDQSDTISRIAGQHKGVEEGLAVANERLAAWRAAPDADSGAQLAVAIAALNADLVAHLDEEERVILPIAAAHITMPEWGELPAHGMQHFAGDKMWLIIGLLQEQFSQEQIAMMESHMPPPVLDFWTNQGRPQFQAYIAEVRG